jgi:GrpB-like predicted nucleotidyltransferase (UPF0157 family)
MIETVKTEINNFDNLTVEQTGRLFPIRIVPHNPDWITLFEREKTLILNVLGEKLALSIEHIGSTAVAGLAAKPTIDILIEVSKLTDKKKQVITRKLAAIGYGNMENAEKEKKMTFGKGYDLNIANSQTYHAHIREKGNMLQDEIYFRDYLRQNSDARDQYAKLKYRLAEKHQYNREKYTQAKTEFINTIVENEKKRP